MDADVIVKGRNVEVPDHFRQLVREKLGRVERYDHKLFRVDVELYHEPNPRQASVCQRVEITCKSRGPVVRSEACAADFYAALDSAIGKLDARLRRSADRRRVHHGARTPRSLAAATAQPPADVVQPVPDPTGHSPNGSTALLEQTYAEASSEPGADGDAGAGARGLVVREKEHPAEPMTLDQAMFEMELVGHDFYLFADIDTGRPSVVYRRKGYDYGVIRLAPA